ncbi:essential DEAH-box ATP-dependent RNA helicase specific to the U3 snoRNP [Myxozyma melibiosi]|uniref:RNA helicase n=1 Tax=Myxozyma melibiosi TaxID=54550 RepID=A0ABR1F1K7_9ASCO
MGKYRPRFNERARAGTVSKQKKLKALRQPRSVRRPEDADQEDEIQQQQQAQPEPAVILKDTSNGVDPNVDILVPITEEERAAKRKELEELFKPPESKMSKQKQKRLDKYIERQLKREERKILMEKLAHSKIDTSLLHSLKKLGTNNNTKREQLRDALLNEHLGILDEQQKKLLYEERQIETEKAPEPEPPTVFNGDHQSLDQSAAPTPAPSTTTSEFKPTFQFGGAGFGFGTLQKKPKPEIQPLKRSQKKVPYTWRARLEQEKLRKAKVAADDEEDYSSSEEESQSEDGEDEDDESVSGESESESGSGSEEWSDGEEWTGFGDESTNGSELNGAEEKNEDEEEDGDEESDGEDEEDEEEESDENDDSDTPRVSRGASFKKWAEDQLRGGTTESLSNINTMPRVEVHYEPVDRPEDRATPPPDIVTIENADQRKSYFVQVKRKTEIQAARIQLPVVQDEQRIMEAIHNNLCVIICGETGSGKTTQVPQFLFEAGYGDPSSDNPGMIGITQPRRVAAVSMAQRVSEELGALHKDKVAYQIRFEQNTRPGTAMKFMTDGVLLRELATDFTLSRYSAIVIDEAHERNVNTDILIGVLSRVLKLRYDMSKETGSKVTPLKLIIMSATLRVTDFSMNSTLFNAPPPVLNVDARQYPVSKHFNRRTPTNYLDEAYNKIKKIHQRLPPGGILVFMTGQSEITHLCKRLRTAFPKQGRNRAANEEVDLICDVAEVEVEDVDLGDDIIQDAFDIDNLSDDEDENEIEEGFEEQTEEINTGPLHVLPLYSLLPTAQQMKIFESPPEGSRLCVVATNIAETSLTIPGIRYVVDCGRVKERHYDEETGVQRFDVGWISKASADQRSGRAGRTGPGHSYRLYSSAVFESEFPQFTTAEILRMPIEGVVLQMKSMGIDTIANFPFPTPPDRNSLVLAERLLHYLGAIDKNGALTDLGRTMSVFPLAPRFAKMVVIGQQFECLQYVIAIVATLSVGDPFLSEHELGIESELLDNADDENEDDEEDDDDLRKMNQGDIESNRRRRKEFYVVQRKFSGLDPTCDVLKMLSVVCAYEFADDAAEFCYKNFLRQKSMEEIHKLRQQLTHIVAINTPKLATLRFDTKLGLPSSVQVKALKQMVTAGFIDQVVVREDLVAGFDASKSTSRAIQGGRKRVKITDIPYVRLNPYTFIKDSRFLSGRGGVDKSCIREPERPVYVHPSSILLSADEMAGVTEMPPFLVYNVIQQSAARNVGDDESRLRIRIKPLTSITAKQLANLAKTV